MTKAEILLKIEILLEQLDESVQKQYSGLKIKEANGIVKYITRDKEPVPFS